MSRPRGRSWRTFVLIGGAALAYAGCDSGPGGPGSLLVRASGPALGAVVLDVRGTGIQGFEGRGSTQVYSGPVAGAEGRYRVILVDAVGGDLGFDIRVDDLGMEGPVVTVVQAADTSNAVVLTSTVAVTMERQAAPL